MSQSREHPINRLLTILMILAMVSFSLGGCAPRGETKTLEQVVLLAKADFAEERKGGEVSGQVDNKLRELQASLSKLERSNSSEYAATAEQIVDALAWLIPRGGYPSRPGAGELLEQFASVAKNTRTIDQRTALLMVGRTYRYLAEELSTTRFALQG